MPEPTKTRVAVLFGGRSTEHEISIITALQIIEAFDATRFDPFPVYIDQEGYWYCGESLRQRSAYIPTPEQKDNLDRVQLVCDPGAKLVSMPKKGGLFSKPKAREYPVDVFFPAFHGTYGEDGCIQGALEFIGAPYTGCGPRAASIGMNKFVCKMLVASQGVPVLDDILLDRNNWDPNRADELVETITQSLPLPLIVKPCNLGSSVAVSSAKTGEDLMVSLAGAFAFDHQVIVEPLMQDFYELNVSVLYDTPPRVSAVERPIRDDALLTFEEKYMKGNKKGGGEEQGMASMDRDIDPQDVPQELKEKVKVLALKAYRILDCRGAVRFDFLVENENNNLYFNEVNTLPGSLAYYLWEKADPPMTFTELLTHTVEQALQEHNQTKASQRQMQRKIFQE